MHFMDAVAAEQRESLDAERERQESERELEARYVRRETIRTRDAASVESWYFASCGFAR